MKQYPHFLFVLKSLDSTQNDDGSWTDAVQEWQLVTECREEPNGSGKMVNGQDGNAVLFSSEVFFPLGAVTLKTGDKITVSESDKISGTIRLKDQMVIRAYNGQLHTKIWV